MKRRKQMGVPPSLRFGWVPLSFYQRAMSETCRRMLDNVAMTHMPRLNFMGKGGWENLGESIPQMIAEESLARLAAWESAHGLTL